MIERNRVHLIALVALAVACGKKDDDNSEPAPEPPAAPADAAAAPAASAADAYVAYIAAFNERDEKALAASFVDDAELALADADEPLSGPAAIVQNNVDFWTALPDTRLEPQVILARGNKVAALLIGHGTHTGSMKTPAGELAPTGSETGGYGLEIVDLNDSGKITAGTQFWDVGLLLQQMQKEKAARPAIREGAKAPTIVELPADAPPSEHVETVRASIEAFNKGDLEGASKPYGDDAVYLDMALPADLTGKKAIAEHMAAQRKAFSDLTGEIEMMWGAGDYVVAVVRYTGTNDGTLGAQKKPTGKKLALTSGQMVELGADGLIKRHWVITNSVSFMSQLGMMPGGGN
jgi:steroid delta-isomerase-like uncharacterized protein